MNKKPVVSEKPQQTVKNPREQLSRLENRIDLMDTQLLVPIWRIDFSPPLPMDASRSEKIRAVFEDTTIREGNDALARAFGYTKAKEVVGRPLQHFFSQSILGNISTTENLIDSGFHIEKVITQNTNADGNFFYALNSIFSHIADNHVLYMWGISVEITELITIQNKLGESEQELKVQQKILENKNIALRELIAQIELNKDETRKHLQANIEKVVLPFFDKLKLNSGSKKMIDQCRKSLEDIITPFGYRISDSRINLTPREMEVCSLVKNGNSNKEISDLLNIALHTVEKHRRTARKKLGLTNTKTNLTTYFNSL